MTREQKEAQKMLEAALEAERKAQAALEKSRNDRRRAERMLAQSLSVTRELRRHREQNHFTDMLIQLFGGKQP